MMRRWILKADATDLGGLVMEDVPLPEPGPGEVRMRVRAVSLNFRDQIVLKDPHWRTAGRDLVPISDGAGEIDAVGEGVSDWKIGDRVTALQFRDWRSGPPRLDMGMGLGALDDDGMLSEYLVLPAQRVARMPESLGFAEASTLPIAGVTAWNALYGDHPIGPGSKVLVLGTGGVALFALLLARAAGAEVFATSSHDDKLDRLKGLGVAGGINYRTHPEWGQAVLELTGGVDKVVDSVGMVNQSLMAVSPGGEVALFGLMASDGPPNPMLLLGKSVNLRGIVVGNAQAYGELVDAVDRHGIKPPLDDRFRFKFEDAKEAYGAQSSPDLFGKIVIDVA